MKQTNHRRLVTISLPITTSLPAGARLKWTKVDATTIVFDVPTGTLKVAGAPGMALKVSSVPDYVTMLRLPGVTRLLTITADKFGVGLAALLSASYTQQVVSARTAALCLLTARYPAVSWHTLFQVQPITVKRTLIRHRDLLVVDPHYRQLFTEVAEQVKVVTVDENY